MCDVKIKEHYLSELRDKGYKEGTMKYYRNVLMIAQSMEQEIHKNLYEFNFHECDVLLKSYKNRSFDMVNINKSVLESFVDFCEINNYGSSIVNFFKNIARQDLWNYVDQNAIENKYLTYEQLREAENSLINYQDSAILRALFVGLKGKELHELISLTDSQVKFEKIILEDREILIDDETYDILKKAHGETEYERGNGDAGGNSNLHKNYINESEYVFRPTGKKKFGAINHMTLRLRFDRLKKYLGMPYITFNSIWFSGMIHCLKEIKEKNGQLTDEDYVNIHERFGYSAKYINKTKEEISYYI